MTTDTPTKEVNLKSIIGKIVIIIVAVLITILLYLVSPLLKTYSNLII